MTKISDDACPQAAVLGAYVDGTLSAARVEEVTRHVTRCARCRLAIANVVEIEQDEEVAIGRPDSVKRRWIAVAAGLLLLAVAIATFREQRDETPSAAMAKLVAASPKSVRTIEPRLSGGFPWAPFRGLRRDIGKTKSPEELVASGAAGSVLRELGDDRRAESLHVAGIAYLVAGDPHAAVKFLTSATERAATNAQTWNDLSAALFMAAEGNDVLEFRRALDAAHRAIRLDARLAEAHFNRALILEQIGTPEQVKGAWRDYLARFPEGPWAIEARERLGRRL